MSNENEYKALKTLVDGALSVQLNMSDTFDFACADAEEISIDDFDKIRKIVAKYGYHALIAYAAVKRGQEPIQCKCGHDGPPYQAAKKEILKVKESFDYFMKY